MTRALFLSTPSARRATYSFAICLSSFAYFYPRPPRGGRLDNDVDKFIASFDFYPRPPRGGRRAAAKAEAKAAAFLSTPSARRATEWAKNLGIYQEISIHALREEGDTTTLLICQEVFDFYPRPPRGGRPISASVIDDRLKHFYPRPPRGGRRTCQQYRGGNPQFLSTPSARRATAKTETKSLFSYKLYNILHEFRRALIYSGSKNYPNHAK